MPGVTLHFLLADRALQAWSRGAGSPPFPATDPEALNAFYHGAVGPDLGYFPGGVRWLSELAHCLRTGALARTLVRSARGPVERAFAWGWVTHVLADQAIHPWVGRGVGELLHGDRDRVVDGSTDLLAHLRVEMGLDAWHAARAPAVRRRRLRPAFHGREIGFLARAYTATYGVKLAEELFLRSHEAAGRRAGQALATLRLVHALMDGGSGFPVLPGVRRALRVLLRFRGLRCVTLAYLTPVRPAPWLLEGVDAEMARHTERFLLAVEHGARDLPDWNLDTGRLIARDPGHPGTRRARAALAARTADPGGGPVGSGGALRPGLRPGGPRARAAPSEARLPEPSPLASEA